MPESIVCISVAACDRLLLLCNGRHGLRLLKKVTNR